MTTSNPAPPAVPDGSKQREKKQLHPTSLLDSELEARRPLAKRRKPHGKAKADADPSIGHDLTDKILMSMMLQDQTHGEPESEPLHFPTPESSLDDIPDSDGSDDVDLGYPDEEERQLFEYFRSNVPEVHKQLDKIVQKTQLESDPSLRQLYEELGPVLRWYRTGSLPKAVSMLASQKISGWMFLLRLSDPEHWSLGALREITLLFARTGSDKKARMFYREILMARVWAELEKKGRLPKELFRSLGIAARRPRCFVMGVLADLASSSHVTVHEARVVAAILMKIRLPREHVNAFLIQLAEAPHTPASLVFVATLMAKGTTLAVQAIDAMVAYFSRFASSPPPLPVMWHRALLDFVKRNAREILEMQRCSLGELVRVQRHKLITPEILAIFADVPPREE